MSYWDVSVCCSCGLISLSESLLAAPAAQMFHSFCCIYGEDCYYKIWQPMSTFMPISFFFCLFFFTNHALCLESNGIQVTAAKDFAFVMSWFLDLSWYWCYYLMHWESLEPEKMFQGVICDFTISVEMVKTGLYPMPDEFLAATAKMLLFEKRFVLKHVHMR